ncbi:hypothetical protein CWC46_09965 [Prodigiosinella confusarubida]|uniref:Isochorismatase-like domain-containing protein n=1 Tax=Serratia sp. (strain ATCC 39006) TaxID=104623 RepID=A0A2I5TIN7_SERS3|nr:isochorismatase family protein [Serratia sp. ATCC 39006]AUH00101.1 hypothetical protein CWC46_09965 [Serratia sp. ATCC 39006]AUH04420.1 hypothetical protein Ser39006_009970 [Serratia sp. ATCC 39006]
MHDRDYTIMVVEDACAASSEEEHRESMKVLATIAGVVSVENLKDL